MKTDIAFVNLLDVLNLYTKSKPLGLLSLYNKLEDNDFEAKIFDFNYIYRKPGKKIVLSNNPLINSYRMANYILSHEPKIVSVYTMCNNLNDAIQLCEVIKSINEEIITILAGPQGTALAKEILINNAAVDLIGYGEGENTIVDIVNHLFTYGLRELFNVEGIAYRGLNGDVVITKQYKLTDLNMLRPFKFELIDDIENIKKSAIEMEVGRGCPFSCKYCSTSMFWGRKFRVKSVSKVIDEIKYYKKKYGNNLFLFHHDLLTFKKQYIMDLCNMIIEQDINIYWACYSRLDVIDTEMINIMSKAGCRKIYFGIESGSPKIQKIINKNLDLEKIGSILPALIKNNIFSEYSFISGFPEETEQDLKMTIRFCAELRRMQVELGKQDYEILIDMFQIQFYPGTEMTEKHYDDLHFSEFATNLRLLNPYYPILITDEFLTRVKENRELFINYYNITENLSPKKILAPLFCMIVFNALYKHDPLKFVEYLDKGWNILDFYNCLWETNQEKVIILIQELIFNPNLNQGIQNDILKNLTKILEKYLG